MIATLLLSSLLALGLALPAALLLRHKRRPALRRLAAALLLIFALPPAALSAYLLARLALGQTSPTERTLAPGVTYRRLVLSSPRPVVAHVVEVDLPLAHPRFVATAPTSGTKTAALTATEALPSLGADLVLNANYFTPFRERDPLSYSPHSGDPVQALGPALASGLPYGFSPPGPIPWTTFWATPSGLVGLGPPPPGATTAVSGRGWLLRSGQAVPLPSSPEPLDPRPYPRTALGLDPKCRRLFLVVVDGKQPRYSDGLTRSELASLLLSLGASDALPLDGGGSSSLALRSPDGSATLLNRPCHTKLPGRQRPVANFLGLIFPPREPPTSPAAPRP